MFRGLLLDTDLISMQQWQVTTTKQKPTQLKQGKKADNDGCTGTKMDTPPFLLEIKQYSKSMKSNRRRKKRKILLSNQAFGNKKTKKSN